jgi:hypothetical protein
MTSCGSNTGPCSRRARYPGTNWDDLTSEERIEKDDSEGEYIRSLLAWPENMSNLGCQKFLEKTFGAGLLKLMQCSDKVLLLDEAQDSHGEFATRKSSELPHIKSRAVFTRKPTLDASCDPTKHSRTQRVMES